MVGRLRADHVDIDANQILGGDGGGGRRLWLRWGGALGRRRFDVRLTRSGLGFLVGPNLTLWSLKLLVKGFPLRPLFLLGAEGSRRTALGRGVEEGDEEVSPGVNVLQLAHLVGEGGPPRPSHPEELTRVSAEIMSPRLRIYVEHQQVAGHQGQVLLAAQRASDQDW